jgi:hypothetical protein
MKLKQMQVSILAVLLLAGAMAVSAWAQDQQAPKVKIPESGVPQIMTIEGEYIRAAYNNEGYVILGYKLANNSVGQPWILLEVGVTMRKGAPNYKMLRSAVSLETPDGKTVPLPTNEEFQAANLMALENRAKVIRDSINYFPGGAVQPCRIGFFAELTNSRTTSYDQVELSWDRACVGRLYFPVAGGIQHGQYWLNMKFEQTLIRVPFKILTKDEQKVLKKNYKSIKKQVEEAFDPKKN